MARRVAIYTTQVVALRTLCRSSRCTLRDVSPRVHAGATWDRDRKRLLPLPPLRKRSDRVAHRARTDVPESHAAEAAGADGGWYELDGPFSGVGALRSPA